MRRHGQLAKAPPPWPFTAPATALARVAAAGSSTAAPRRFQVGPRLPLLPLPAAAAAPSGPLLSPRWDGRAAVVAGALTTPPAGNRGLCSVCMPAAAEVRPCGSPPPLLLGQGWSSEGKNRSSPWACLTWHYPGRKGVPVPRCWESPSSCPVWPERFVHPSSISSVVSG